MKRILFSWGILACLASSSCNKENSVAIDDPQGGSHIESILLTKAEEGYVRTNNRFAWNLFRDISRGTEENFVISPLSVTFTLGMIGNGATGRTQEEINAVLGYGDIGIDAVNEFCHKMMDGTVNLDHRIEMMLANAAVIDKDFPVKRSFIRNLKEFYLAEVFMPDFSDPEAVALINAWCSKHTRTLIPTLIEELAPNAQACFLNAVHFKAPWTIKFDASESAPAPFFDHTGTIKLCEVDMMHLCAEVELFERETYTALELDLGSRAFKMTFYLPDKGTTVDETIDVLLQENNSPGKAERRLREVDIKLPRFETAFEADLNEPLKKLGMSSAFGTEGSFLNLADDPALYLGLVKQKAKITVDEAGAEAAAATIGEMVEKGLHKLEFHANRQFLYTIRESGTSSLVFMGRYNGKDCNDKNDPL